jgi:hypothetical protein
MRIVNREEFLKLPEGTVFQKYAPCTFGPICIKYENSAGTDFYDLCTQDISFVGSNDDISWVDCCTAMEKGETRAVEFVVSRDGLHHKDQLFAIWSELDVLTLKRLIDELPAVLTPITIPTPVLPEQVASENRDYDRTSQHFDLELKLSPTDVYSVFSCNVLGDRPFTCVTDKGEKYVKPLRQFVVGEKIETTVANYHGNGGMDHGIWSVIQINPSPTKTV